MNALMRTENIQLFVVSNHSSLKRMRLKYEKCLYGMFTEFEWI